MKAIQFVATLIIGITTANAATTDQIDPGRKREVLAVNQAVISALYKQDMVALEETYSDSAKNMFSNNIDLSKNYLCQFGQAMESDSLTIEHLFYSTTSIDSTLLFRGERAPNYYRIKTKAFSNETCFIVNLVAIKQQSDSSVKKQSTQDTLFILTNYSTYNGVWKLNQMRISELTHNGIRAEKYYQMAKESLNKGHYIQSMDHLQGLYFSSMPFNNLYRWDNSEASDSLRSFVYEEHASKLPVPDTLTEIQSKPYLEYFRIDQGKNLEFLPTFVYATTIPMDDTVAIMKENREIHNMVEKILHEKIQDKFRIQYYIYEPGNYQRSIRLMNTDTLIGHKKIWPIAK